MQVKYGPLPDKLHFCYQPQSVRQAGKPYIKLVACQADELWWFVQRKDNVYHVWQAMHSESRQVIALYVGDRSRDSAKKLCNKIPQRLQETALFHTDDWHSYNTIIAQERHLYSKVKGYTIILSASLIRSEKR